MVSPRNRRVITLTEVMVAVVILLMLIGILIPVLSSVRGNAEETACASAARQNGMAILMYAQDNDTCYPLQDQSNIQEDSGKGRGGAVVDNWKVTTRPNWAAGILTYT